MKGRAAVLALLAAACAAWPPEPAVLDTKNDACAWCRMSVSDARFAAQLVAPGEEPRFFDDIGCFAEYLRSGKVPGGAAAYVADHRTKTWIAADRAVYTKVPGLETPMGSHLVAHSDAASRDADPDAKLGAALPATQVFGGSLPGGAS